MTTSSRSSDIQTADASIATGRNRINSVILLADGTNAASLVIYDNASAASGKVLASLKVKATDVQKEVVFTFPVIAENGIYADVTGTGASYIVHFGA